MLSESRLDLRPLPRIVFGAGSAGTLAKEVTALGGRHAVVVTDKGLVNAGVIAPIVERLDGAGITTTVFDGVEPNPTTENVLAGGEAARGHEDPVIIAIGGGSSLDAAKAIGLSASNPGPAESLTVGNTVANPSPPIIAVPTTAGTGSENNMFSLITGGGRKLYIAHASTLPRLSVLDPTLTLGLPKVPTATCGMDVLTHAMEALVARRGSPYSDGVALEAIRMVAQNLPTAFAQGTDLEARSQLLLASNMASIAFGYAGLGACHGAGHPLSARYGLAHGQTLATLLPAVMELNMDVSEAKYARAAFALGVGELGRSDADNARAAVGAVRELRAKVETDKTLTQLGVPEDGIDQLVQDAMADFVTAGNPKRVTPEDMAALYRSAL